jgi:alpha-glucosidase
MTPPSFKKSLRVLSVGLTSLVLASMAWAQVAETLGPRIAVFYPSEAAKHAALPSFALIVPRRGPPGADGVMLRPEFSVRNGQQVVTVPIPPNTALYGTGEVTGPLLRNGHTVTLWNSDAYGYDARTPALYESHPWVLGVRADGSAFGMIFDSTYRQKISLPPLSGGSIETVADGPAFPVIVVGRSRY